MQNRSATLVLLNTDPATGPMVTEAARLAFSKAHQVQIRSLQEALQTAPGVDRDDLLVLQDPCSEDLAAARGATDAEGLSRWPIVVLTTGDAPWDDGRVEWVPQELWSPQGLARAFRSAVSHHDLFRENQRARGDLLTVARRVSHDLRSPLNGVVATGEMLKDMVADHEPDAEALAAPLFRSVDGLVKLIERVGVVLNATAQQPAPKKVDMATAVSNALQRLERQLLEKKIKVQRGSNWPEVLGVEAWNEVIWWNLIRNAIQHGEGVSQIELAWEPCHGGFRFWIRDDGKGVPAEKVKTLFRPFHALHDQSAPKGFGLPTVQRLVELQGGICGCEAKTHGAAFFFTLPSVVDDKKPGHGEEHPTARVASKPVPVSGETPKAPSNENEEAHQNAARLGLALDAAKLGGWIWDPVTDVITFFGHGAEIYGVPADAKITRTQLRGRLHEDDQKRAVAANEAAIATKTDYDIEYRMRHGADGWRWVTAKGRGIYDASGKLTGMLGVVQDITARKGAEDTLRKKNERLELLSDALAQLIGAKNPKEIVRDLLPKVAAHLNTDTYFNYLVNETGDALVMNACAGIPEETARSIQRLEFGQAICGTVAVTRQPIHATDIQHSGYDKANLVRGFGIQAYACHPFLVEGHFLGTLSFASRQRPRFDEDELDFMRTISQYVALALDRARSEQQLADRSRSLQIINRAGSTLAAELDLNRLVQTVTDAGREISGAAYGAFFYNVRHESGEALQLYTLSGAPPEAFEKFGLPRNTPLFAKTFSGEGIVRIGDVLTDPSYGKLPPHHGMPEGHLPVRSYLAVPVKSRSGEVLGGLFFGHPEPNIFTEQSETILAGIASQTAVAIDNARLYTTLRSSEKQLQFVTDYAPVSLAHLDRSCRYKFVNRAYAVRFERPVEDIVGRHASDVLGQEVFETALPHIEAALSGQEVAYEMEMLVGSFGPRWMSVVYVPERTPEGAVVGFVAMSSDITSRKHAEQEAERARDQALAASRAKDDFLAALSHELRTPLNPVLLLASEAAQNLDLPSEVREDFAIIRKNVELEARLIDDLLDITRITRGKLFLEVGPVDVHSVLQDALSAVKATLEQKKIVFNLDCRAEPHVIMGDSVRVQQVFWNVLNNAVKFTPPSGTIAVSTDIDAASRRLVIKISDSGVGMTEEELSEVFNAFSQGEHADDGGSHRFGGLGLGLAISRMLVEQHSGAIRAESPGRDQGATFVIEFPLPGIPLAMTDAPADSSSTPLSAMVASSSSGEPLRILLVEDHEATRVALMQLLARRRFSVTSAASLGEARAVAARERFHLLISDIGLPDGNGCELMSELRGSQGLSGIALTGYGMENDIARTREAGFATHLIKPLSVQSLEKAIAHVLAYSGGKQGVTVPSLTTS